MNNEFSGTGTQAVEEKADQSQNAAAAEQTSDTNTQTITNEDQAARTAGETTGRPIAAEQTSDATTQSITNEDLTANTSSNQIAGNDEAAQPVSGFGPFRMWANRQIRTQARPPLIKHAGEDYLATEITHEGKLRLQLEEKLVLVPFDERYIPSFLGQLNY